MHSGMTDREVFMSAYVELKDVKKIYKMGEIEIDACDGINFEINKGEFAVIVGPSGAGKTTVLNILGGMDTATSGDVIVDGRNISQLKNKKLVEYRREDIGFVFQFLDELFGGVGIGYSFCDIEVFIFKKIGFVRT